MINEDGTSDSRSVMAEKHRDGSIWRLDLTRGFTADRVAELDPPGRDGTPVGPGVWETSGIIDASAAFGRNSWITDVQAHPPTNRPSPDTVEDGQLVLLLPTATAEPRRQQAQTKREAAVGGPAPARRASR